MSYCLVAKLGSLGQASKIKIAFETQHTEMGNFWVENTSIYFITLQTNTVLLSTEPAWRSRSPLRPWRCYGPWLPEAHGRDGSMQ